MNNNFGNDRPFCRREDTVYAATVWRTWYCRNVRVLVLVLTESLPRSLRRPVFIWPNNHYCRRVFCYFTAHQTVKCPQSWVFVDLVNPLRPLEDHEKVSTGSQELKAWQTVSVELMSVSGTEKLDDMKLNAISPTSGSCKGQEVTSDNPVLPVGLSGSLCWLVDTTAPSL